MIHYYVLLALGVGAISCAAPLFKVAQPTDPLLAAAIRLSVATLLWMPWMLQTYWTQGVSTRVWRSGMWAGVCYSVHFGAWVASLGLCSVIMSTSLVTTTPLFLALWAWWTGVDMPNRLTWFALALACFSIGLFVVQTPSQAFNSHYWGIILSLVAAMAMAVYLLLSRALGSEMQLAPFAWMATFSAALILWGCCLIQTQPLIWPTALGYKALIASAVIPQMVGHTCLTYCVKTLTPTQEDL